jgi:hypothetical protein
MVYQSFFIRADGDRSHNTEHLEPFIAIANGRNLHFLP